MNEYQKFYDTFKGIADIYILYILEAHFVEKDEQGNFTDGWPIGYQYNYSQPKTIEERKDMVKVLIDEFHPTIPILVDPISNSFQQIYRPWPDRAFMFKDGKVEYMAKINDDGTRNTYWTNELSELLK